LFKDERECAMANDFRVEKRQVQVGLFMADGVIFEGVLFLAQYTDQHSGGQTVQDLLLENDPFLPMKTTNGDFHLIRKGMISHLRCPIELDPGLELVERQVRISFLGNEALQGTVRINMPEHRARLTDFINDGDEFFPLFSGEHEYLVNRSLVRDIVVIG
jgi:hypothetical protein